MIIRNMRFWDFVRNLFYRVFYVPARYKYEGLVFGETFSDLDDWINGHTWSNLNYTYPELTGYGAKFVTTDKTQALITSRFMWKYGRFVFNGDLPDGKYDFPAFWLWGADDDWYAEIDCEWMGDKDTLNVNLYWGEKYGDHQLRTWGIKVKNMSEVVIEWSPGKIEWFADGRQVFVYSNRNVLDKWFDKKLWLVVNLGVLPECDTKDHYSEMFVRSVKIYE